MFRRLAFLLALAALAATSASLSADAALMTVAQWTYETSVPINAGPHAAEVGTGSSTGVHASGATVYSNPVGNGSGESFSSNTWAIGDYYQFQTSTVGVGGVQLSWGQTRSSTGPAGFDLQWSTNGTTFTTAMSYVVPVLTWSSLPANFQAGSVFTANLQSVSELNDQANVYFRLLATSAGSAAAGTNRVDDFTVSVPEPASVALMLLAAVGMFGVRRRGC